MSVAVLRVDETEELAAFMAAFPDVRPLSVTAWRSRLAAWWDRNPAFEEAFPRGWVLRDGGRIVGFFGSLPLKLQLAGRETTVFSATSWRVLPPYRGQSLTLKLRQLQVHNADIHFSTTPQAAVIPLLERLGYQALARGPAARTQSQLILDAAKFLRYQRRATGLAAPLARLGAPLVAAVQAVRTRRLRAAAPGTVQELTHADAAFDELWERTRRRFATTNIRTAALLNWYCFAMQPVTKTLLAYFARDTLWGYMVFLHREDPARRLLECVDLWIDPAGGELEVVGGLVAQAWAYARREGFERVLFPHFDARTAALYGALGLLRGPAWPRREYIKGPRELLAAITPENSYFVRAQGDYGL